MEGYGGAVENSNDVVVMSGLQIAMSREIWGWPIYTIIIAAGQVSQVLHCCEKTLY